MAPTGGRVARRRVTGRETFVPACSMISPLSRFNPVDTGKSLFSSCIVLVCICICICICSHLFDDFSIESLHPIKEESPVTRRHNALQTCIDKSSNYLLYSLSQKLELTLLMGGGLGGVFWSKSGCFQLLTHFFTPYGKTGSTANLQLEPRSTTLLLPA